MESRLGRTSLIMLCAAGLATAGCQPEYVPKNGSDGGEGEGEVPAVPEATAVTFSISTPGFSLPEGTYWGLAAICARDGKDGVSLGGKEVSEYVSVAEGEASDLVNVAVEDLIEMQKGDHSFRFYAVHPYAETVDFTAIEASLPAVQKYEDGTASYLPFAASKRMTALDGKVELEAKHPFVVLNLSVPSNIVDEDKNATLQKIVITPAKPAKFTGALAGRGTFNAETGAFIPAQENASANLTLEFPAEGLPMTESTTIQVVMLPGDVPEGGYKIEFFDMDGTSHASAFLNKPLCSKLYCFRDHNRSLCRQDNGR